MSSHIPAIRIQANRIRQYKIIMQKKITALAPAKINVFLEITSRRSDGYHNIQSIFCLIDLADKLVFEKLHPGRRGEQKQQILFTCDRPELNHSNNIVVKSALRILRAANSPASLRIKLEKKIPWGAGLGGGSSDAAATLLAIRDLLKLKISDEELKKIGLDLGADVPFFLSKFKCAHVEGIGEKISPLSPSWIVNTGDKKKITIVIAKPDFSISTKDAYSRVKFPLTGKKEIDKILALISSSEKFEKIARLFYNRFEKIIPPPQLKEIKILKKILIAGGALNAVMSGSGSAVAGFFMDAAKAEQTASVLLNKKSGSSVGTYLTHLP